MEFVLLWLFSVISLSTLTDKDIKDSSDVIDYFLNELQTIISFFAFIGLVVITYFGLYVWFNGFYGYHIEGFYRFMLGTVIWPLVPFWIFQIIRGFYWAFGKIK